MTLVRLCPRTDPRRVPRADRCRAARCRAGPRARRDRACGRGAPRCTSRARRSWCIRPPGACCCGGTSGCSRGCRSVATPIRARPTPSPSPCTRRARRRGWPTSSRGRMPNARRWCTQWSCRCRPATAKVSHEHADLRFVLATERPDAIVEESAHARLRWLTLDDAIDARRRGQPAHDTRTRRRAVRPGLTSSHDAARPTCSACSDCST